ncbi:rhodanese-like domain-containing protein [Streptomyces hainanensis]|uniref:Rhodanese-like domain-containing protein n=1 Tax=Streptomyces hainanensis TaxID=402648 RepID=A0A4R4TVV6_9ACTN|nr:rhodanese-like domain-containing protein [Streptomyces hainanensis]TDC80174.1 rhodanese-like domain-containing protein [Streptomyces hainanensis]
MSFAAVQNVSPDAVPQGAPLLDVREPEEWLAGHAPGAVHIPIGQVVERLPEIRDAAAEQTLYVVCKVGGRSAQVAAYLAQQGLDVVNVDGGLHAWQHAGRPLVAEQDGAEPFVL